MQTGAIGNQTMQKQKLGLVIKRMWKVGSPYWTTSPEKWGSLVLLIIAIGFLGLQTAVSVRSTIWNREWTNAFTSRDTQLWLQQLPIFFINTVSMAVAIVFNLYLTGWIKVRWRRWMTARYTRLWMENKNHYKMQLTGSETDNPDQRISEDLNMFIEETWGLTFEFVQVIINTVTYISMLWSLSMSLPIIIGGIMIIGDTNAAPSTVQNMVNVAIGIPGYLILLAIIWSVVKTFVTHKIGKPRARLSYQQRMFEANFRFELARFRENTEQIALLDGEPNEHGRVMFIFGNAILNTFRTLGLGIRTGFTEQLLNFADAAFFSLILGPAFFLYGAISEYGIFMQIASAFLIVVQGFSWVHTNYFRLAPYVATIDRLYAFNDNYEKMKEVTAKSELKVINSGDDIHIKDVDVFLPSGKKQISAEDITVKQGDKVLIKGRTGAGKTTMFRAMSGIWPFGTGTVTLPEDKRIIILPQRPYFPIGTLLDAVCYPASSDTYSREDVRQALLDVGMVTYADKLDEIGHWNNLLSGGEQQRLGIARAMLYKPDYLFFDEATASMDESSEEELYTMLTERMKDTAIISIGHRSSLLKYHKRLLVAEGDPEGSYNFEEQDIKKAIQMFREEETK